MKGKYMGYVEGFLLAIPESNKSKYLKMAEEVAQIFKKHGALRVVECWGQDIPDGKLTDFKRSVKLESGENVVFSWVMWPDKKTRDEGSKKVHDDVVKMEQKEMPFDGKRMVWGGFEILYDSNPGAP